LLTHSSNSTSAFDLPRGIVISAVCIALSSASGALIGARHGCCPKPMAGWMHQYGLAAGRYERRNEIRGSLSIEGAYSLRFLSFFLFLPCLGFGVRGVHAGMPALWLVLFGRVGWHHMRIALRALRLCGSVTSRGGALLRCRSFVHFPVGSGTPSLSRRTGRNARLHILSCVAA
jgi:hypothetical protein